MFYRRLHEWAYSGESPDTIFYIAITFTESVVVSSVGATCPEVPPPDVPRVALRCTNADRGSERRGRHVGRPHRPSVDEAESGGDQAHGRHGGYSKESERAEQRRVERHDELWKVPEEHKD